VFVWDLVTARPLTTFHDADKMVFSSDRRSVALVGTTGVRLWSPRFPVPSADELQALHVK